MTLRILAAAGLTAGLAAFGAAPGPAGVSRETVWTLEINVVATGPGTGGSLGTFAMTASRATPGTLEVPLGGPGSWPGGVLRLTAVLDRLLEDGASIALASEVTPRHGRRASAERRFDLREGGSQLVEIFGDRERHLLISIRGEEGTRPVVRRFAAVGARVLLRVEIERIDGTRSVALETNDLNTFVGEPVEYSFDFGGGGERLRLVLTPLSLTGSIAQVRAQITGQLPDVAGPIILSRDQSIAASRGATSSVEVVAGDPPRGYRFRITPDF
jgi:hypothetical protein